MKSKIILFSLITAVLQLPGLNAHAVDKQELIERLISGYDPEISTTTTDLGRSFFGCALTKVEIKGKDPLTGKLRSVHAKQYVPRRSTNPSSHPSVIVMPPTGGETMLDQGYANSLCREGFRALLVQSWEGDSIVELDMGMHDRGAIRAMTAVRHAVEFLTFDQIERSVGILGNSVGANIAALVLGTEARISTGVLITGGTGMSEIIAKSSEKTLTKLRSERLASFGFKDQAAYEEALRQHVLIDPKDFVNLTGPKSVLMVVATEDITVPSKNQWDLYEAFGRQELITRDDNHFNTIIYSSVWLKGRMIDYLRRNLD